MTNILQFKPKEDKKIVLEPPNLDPVLECVDCNSQLFYITPKGIEYSSCNQIIIECLKIKPEE